MWADLFHRIMQNMFHLSFIRSSRFHNTHGYTYILHKRPYPRLTVGWHQHIFFECFYLSCKINFLSKENVIEMFVQTNGLQPPRDKVHILTFVSQRFVLMIPFLFTNQSRRLVFLNKEKLWVTFFLLTEQREKYVWNVCPTTVSI